jgi:hypothetical protein
MWRSKKSFERILIEHGDFVIHIGESPERVKILDHAHL